MKLKKWQKVLLGIVVVLIILVVAVFLMLRSMFTPNSIDDTTVTFDQINKYFTIQEMPIVSSRYWNVIHGATAEQAKQDAEGLYTMRVLGRNMAYMLRCQEAAKNAGVPLPEKETAIFTNFIR